MSKEKYSPKKEDIIVRNVRKIANRFFFMICMLARSKSGLTKAAGKEPCL